MLSNAVSFAGDISSVSTSESDESIDENDPVGTLAVEDYNKSFTFA